MGTDTGKIFMFTLDLSSSERKDQTYRFGVVTGITLGLNCLSGVFSDCLSIVVLYRTFKKSPPNCHQNDS